MSAELLRSAASLMRERATAAPVPAGPWEAEFSDVIRTDVPFGGVGYLIAECATTPEAQYIAGMHPAVALAVADWLDWLAPFARHEDDDAFVVKHGLAVARVYLGSDS